MGFSFNLKMLDLANPLVGFFLVLIISLLFAVAESLYGGLSLAFDKLVWVIILVGSAWYCIGIFAGNFFVKRIARLQRYLRIVSNILLIVAIYLGLFFFLADTTSPWQLDLLIAISVFILFILFPELGHGFIGRMAIELGVIFVALSFILLGVIPTLSYGFFKLPTAIGYEAYTSPIVLTGYCGFILGSTFLMTDNRSWNRIWGFMAALLGVLFFYWLGLWFFIAGILLTILLALRCFDAMNEKEELLIFFGMAILFLLLIVSPRRAFIVSTFTSFWRMFFSLDLVIKSSDLLIGTTGGGVLFGIPDGRVLMSQMIYQKIGGTWTGGGIDATIFGAPLMDFGIIGLMFFLFLLGFILNIGYKAINTGLKETKKVMISAYAGIYAFSIIAIMRGPDYFLVTLLIILFAVSLSTLSEAISLQSLSLITPEMRGMLSSLYQTGGLMYSLLFDDDKMAVDTLRKFGLVKVHHDVIRITPAGRRVFEVLEQGSSL